jgi:DNA topoisomerase-1
MSIINRQKVGRGFRYLSNGTKITDKQRLDYFKSLRIPPAWQDVEISSSTTSKILATGFDAAGRRQYIYHPDFRARQEQAKFERILKFAQALPRMRAITAKHLNRRKLDKQKVLACIVQLMDRAYFRVGNEVYAKENQSYGITTLRSKHTDVQGDTVIFDFMGKSGKRQHKKITDRTIARIVKRLDDLPGYEIFKYYDDDGNLHPISSKDVNEYIKEIMGEEFTAKDFRTWGGTVLASSEFAKSQQAETERERKKTVTTCVKRVAKKLGNTPAVARSSYIDPRIIQAYSEGYDFTKLRRTVEAMRKSHHMNMDEKCLLVQLKKL